MYKLKCLQTLRKKSEVARRPISRYPYVQSTACLYGQDFANARLFVTSRTILTLRNASRVGGGHKAIIVSQSQTARLYVWSWIPPRLSPRLTVNDGERRHFQQLGIHDRNSRLQGSAVSCFTHRGNFVSTDTPKTPAGRRQGSHSV